MSKDKELDRILSMTDAEILAEMTPEDHKSVNKLSKDIRVLTRCFDAGWDAAFEKAINAFGGDENWKLNIRRVLESLKDKAA